MTTTVTTTIRLIMHVVSNSFQTWRRRWLVVTKMSDLAAGTLAAKVDLYPDDPAILGQGQGRSADRMTFVLDHVTAVQPSTSKTHPFAFEIVETDPVLVLSASSESESFAWIVALRSLFFGDGFAGDTGMFVCWLLNVPATG